MVEEELDFLREIEQSPRDETPRLIYADWLEEHGDNRGAYLRMECDLHRLKQLTPEFIELSETLRAMREDYDPRWLVAVGRTKVGNCATFSIECPSKWEWLVATDQPLVRFCDQCRKQVHYCSSISEAQRKAWEGECVAIDSAMLDADLRTREGESVGDLYNIIESDIVMGDVVAYEPRDASRRRPMEDLSEPLAEPSWWEQLLPWRRR